MKEKRLTLGAIPILLGLSVPNAGADFFGPKNYDDCILENMKGVTNDVAAHAIRNACRDKFPTKCKEIVDLADRTTQEILGTCKKE